jgi:hypothetical protein
VAGKTVIARTEGKKMKSKTTEEMLIAELAMIIPRHRATPLDKAELTKGLRRWAASIDDDRNDQGWTWYGSLRFSSSPSLIDPDLIFSQWFRSILRPGTSVSHWHIREKRRRFCSFRSDVDFALVREHGQFEGNVRFYVLLGSGDKVLSQAYAISQWMKVGGHKAFLHPYESKDAFVEYVVKHVHADSDITALGVDYAFLWSL